MQTDNPDPHSFRLRDKSSKYIAKDKTQSELPYSENDSSYIVYTDPGTFYPVSKKYVDVKYENANTLRVKGGYIFFCYECESDGGELVVQAHFGNSKYDNDYVDTNIKVKCSALKNEYDYLIDNYTNSSMTFFQKLDAVQGALNELSVYPRSVQDTSLPSKDRPYPLLAASPYPEIGLNQHYDMFERGGKGLFLRSFYPFVLDSASTPGTMRAVAQKLNSKAKVEGLSGQHAYIKVTLNGESNIYGGAGAGSSGPLYTKFVDAYYTFKGDSNDMSVNNDLHYQRDKLLTYAEKTKKELEVYKDQITGKSFAKAIGGGSWLKIAAEGWFGYGESYAYVPYNPVSPDYPWIPADVWVDGRYIGMHEAWERGVKYEEQPKADIIIRNVKYTDKNGVSHQNDIHYSYDSDLKMWTAPTYYTNSSWSYMPEEARVKPFVLTEKDVAAMNSDPAKRLDRNTGTTPPHGLIYDGTQKPGTPF